MEEKIIKLCFVQNGIEVVCKGEKEKKKEGEKEGERTKEKETKKEKEEQFKTVQKKRK